MKKKTQANEKGLKKWQTSEKKKWKESDKSHKLVK